MKNAATFGYAISNHALERLYERHGYLFANPSATGKTRWNSAYAVLDDSTENKSIKNDTAFMVFQHETYGYDKEFRFFVNGDVLFIGVSDSVGKIITTTLSCVDSKINRIKNLRENNRFRK